MRKLDKQFVSILFLVSGFILSFTSCTKHDQIIDETPKLQGDTLVSIKAPSTPTISPIGGAAWDGTIEAVWNSATKLNVTATVPDLGNGTFAGFIGNSTNVSIRSMYDANNIYFLVEFDAAQKHVQSSQWYYVPAYTWKKGSVKAGIPTKDSTIAGYWAQEGGAPVPNPIVNKYGPAAVLDGSFRPAFIQDQFDFMFNIANSTPEFTTKSCYAACHANSSYSTATTTGGVMHTNGTAQYLDCWRARTLQTENTNQANDCYLSDGITFLNNLNDGALNKNYVNSDPQTNNGPSPIPALGPYADGGFTNKQTLKSKTVVAGNSKSLNVPIWVYPSGTYLNSAILTSDTLPSGKALKVLSVDSAGVLTLSNSTKIDPTVGTDYQQVGTGDGPKCIPGSVVAPYTGSRGDVTVNSFYTGTGWRMLFSRSLKTSDLKYDADFSSLIDQPFGIGAMFNGADNEHAIAAGLMLRFQK
jgi:hypothetical protein